MRKILIDCCPGVSGAMALLLAGRCRELELAGITTVYGLCSGEEAFRHAGELTKELGLDIPVVRGADSPLFTERITGFGCPADDLPGFADAACVEEDDPGWAWDMLYRQAMASGGELTVLAMGPLTNLAIALFRYEDLPHYVKRIVILGGSAGAGNVTEFGEFNVVSDPHACEVVLRSGIPVTMVGLDALETLCLSAEEVDCIQKKIPEKFGAALSAWNREQIEMGESRITLPGAAAVAVLHDPTLAVSVPRYVRVETVQSGMKGRTVVDIRRHAKNAPNVDVVSTINKEGFLTWLNSLLLDSER